MTYVLIYIYIYIYSDLNRHFDTFAAQPGASDREQSRGAAATGGFLGLFLESLVVAGPSKKARRKLKDSYPAVGLMAHGNMAGLWFPSLRKRWLVVWLCVCLQN